MSNYMGNFLVKRLLEGSIQKAIQVGKSVLLLGPRQIGKTTLFHQLLVGQNYLEYNLADPELRLLFERDGARLRHEVDFKPEHLVFIDEIQKVPQLLDVIQLLVDQNKRCFLLTGSSARKLRRQVTNLLPGRVLSYRVDALVWEEYSTYFPLPGQHVLKQLIQFGEMPEIISMMVNNYDKDIMQDFLVSYVSSYLEEEVRSEALVRNLGAFSKFLHLAAESSGQLVSIRAMSQDLGIPHQTIGNYYQILEDCLIIEKIDSLTPSSQRGRLAKSPKYLFFDLGVLNAACGVIRSESYTEERWGQLFEQWVGLTLLKLIRSKKKAHKLYFWRDYQNKEVDWVLAEGTQYIPIEVKWTQTPNLSHCKHLHYFIDQYGCQKGFLVFPGTRSFKLSEHVVALPFSELSTLLH